jgi:hypothetical protein
MQSMSTWPHTVAIMVGDSNELYTKRPRSFGISKETVSPWPMQHVVTC